MAYNQSAKDEIKRAADIVEFIGQFVQLKKAGQNYVGLCPFHSEKDPSFTVNPERQTFHCFGCKKGGDIFSFWMEYHGSTFPEALRDLAERYNVTISGEYFSGAERDSLAKKDKLYKINETAADYFQKSLMHPYKGKTCRDYLKKRTISKEIAAECRLGYAPDEWDGLIKVLNKGNIEMEPAVETGVIIRKKNGGYYDRFRGRIIFPIFDLRQRVVGFGGRVLDESLPKYLNTPETPLFHKGEFLYGLNFSFKSIREKGRSVIVEGYMDWLRMKMNGMKEAVATLGTALTSNHVRKLKGYAKETVIVFDSDEAGKKATLKSLPVFANEGLFARAVALPVGNDPDSFVSKHGIESLLDLLEKALPMFDFFLEHKLSEKDSDEKKARALKELLPVLSEVRDFTLRSLYVRRLSEKIGVKEDVVLSELNAFIKNPSGRLVKRETVKDLADSKEIKKSIIDLQMLNLLLHFPNTIQRMIACECKILLADPEVVELVDIIFNKFLQEGPFSPEKLYENIKSEAGRKHLREILHRPFMICSEKEAELAVCEIEEKAHQKKILASFKHAKGNRKAQNHLLQLKIQGPNSP